MIDSVHFFKAVGHEVVITADAETHMTMRPEEIQADYYNRTAEAYDDMHIAEGDEHQRALRLISAFTQDMGVESVLDVGCGTGRAIRYFMQRHPEMRVHGVEPVAGLRDQAINRFGVPPSMITGDRGEALPFADQSFDIVCEFGVLHHVRRPETVIAEMLRVARKAVFISDSNRFGQGSFFWRRAKLTLYRCGLWWPVNFVRTRGRGYTISEGDGLAYSYSVYDNYPQVAAWAKQMVLVPTTPHDSPTWKMPLLTSGHVLLCAFRKPL